MSLWFIPRLFGVFVIGVNAILFTWFGFGLDAWLDRELSRSDTPRPN